MSLFISHSSADARAVKAFAARLRQQGYRSFFLSLDPKAGIAAGTSWEDELYRRIRLSRAVIAICSPNWLKSKWCFAEFAQARAMGKAIFTVKVARCRLDGPLVQMQAIDLTSSRTDGYERLWIGLREAGVDPQDELAWDPDRSPYPGLEPFSEADAAVYFGRDIEVQEGLDRLRAMRERSKEADAARLAMVLGPSGSGKSSLVRAGIAPKLARDPSRWIVVPAFRLGGAPIGGLADALRDAFARLPGGDRQAPDAAELRRQLLDPADGLAAVARRLVARTTHRDASVLLTVDQFEELLASDDEAGSFRTLLKIALAAPRAPLVAIATLRSDFLGAFQRSDLGGIPFTSIMLAPMAPEQMAEVIARPAERIGVEIEPGLVRRILAEAGTDDALPLLAFALRLAYERRGVPRRLTTADYERVGGLRGALEKRLQEILDLGLLPTDAERRLRDVFLTMVRINDEGQIARRSTAWRTTPPDVRPALERFVDARLLVSRVVDGERTLDTVHEALFRVWTPLAAWIRDNRPFLDWRRRLQGAIDAGALLPDESLPEAERWLHDRGESLDDAQRRFIDDSRARRDRRLAAEAESQRRELERERALRQAEETARHEAEQRTAEQAEAAREHRALAEEANRRLAETY
jgi:hypothetical protein